MVNQNYKWTIKTTQILPHFIQLGLMTPTVYRTHMSNSSRWHKLIRHMTYLWAFSLNKSPHRGRLSNLKAILNHIRTSIGSRINLSHKFKYSKLHLINICRQQVQQLTLHRTIHWWASNLRNPLLKSREGEPKNLSSTVTVLICLLSLKLLIYASGIWLSPQARTSSCSFKSHSRSSTPQWWSKTGRQMGIWWRESSAWTPSTFRFGLRLTRGQRSLALSSLTSTLLALQTMSWLTLTRYAGTWSNSKLSSNSRQCNFNRHKCNNRVIRLEISKSHSSKTNSDI